MNKKKEVPILEIQEKLRSLEIPAWLFYGFKDIDPIAANILKLPPDHLVTRRWFYLIGATGEPKKIVHKIESTMLDHLPGNKKVYLSWQQLHTHLQVLLNDYECVAMQHSEQATIPSIAQVDGGTIDLVRSCNTKVISSGDLIQHFESVWSINQLAQHRKTAHTLTNIVKKTFTETARQISLGNSPTELIVQTAILDSFQKEGLTNQHPPIVAVNENSADPHYQSGLHRDCEIKKGDFLLIDLWAKASGEDSVYADITWTGFFGPTPSKKLQEIFEIVRLSRERGVDLLRQRFQTSTPLQGWEVDDAVREVISQAGYQDFFLHRTGHNLGSELHGNGLHFDNLETHDTRLAIPGICCTIEPGIYLPGEFGIRSEINVYLDEKGPEVTTPAQQKLLVFPIS